MLVTVLSLFLRAGIKVAGDVQISLRYFLNTYDIAHKYKGHSRVRLETASTLGADVLEVRWTLNKQIM